MARQDINELYKELRATGFAFVPEGNSTFTKFIRPSRRSFLLFVMTVSYVQTIVPRAGEHRNGGT
jgi:hypothetical protein